MILQAPPSQDVEYPFQPTVWLKSVALPSGYENEVWDMVMAAAEMLNIAVALLDHKAQAEHLDHAEAAAFFGRKEHG